MCLCNSRKQTPRNQTRSANARNANWKNATPPPTCSPPEITPMCATCRTPVRPVSKTSPNMNLRMDPKQANNHPSTPKTAAIPLGTVLAVKLCPAVQVFCLLRKGQKLRALKDFATTKEAIVRTTLKAIRLFVRTSRFLYKKC